MPEIGEVARIVSRLRANLVGKTISEITVVEDSFVYKDTTHNEFKNALQGKKVIAARQWGKYFWLVMDSPPHPLMHFGMSGWIYIKNDPYAHYRSSDTTKVPEWPPKHLKFKFKLSNADEIVFTDARRLGRIRLINHPSGDIRGLSPLVENGPDPVLDPVSIGWITEKLGRRRMPVKAWLLDQSAIAGIGNWVGDEILYHARIHPEQHANTLSTSQVASLHRALGYVTKLTVEVEADSTKFPENWLMLHRWGKKGEVKLSTGEDIEFIKVGSRTSAYVPSLQKMPGEEGDEGEKDAGVDKGSGGELEVKKPTKKRASKKISKKEEDSEGSEVEDKPVPKRRAPARPAKKIVKKDETEEEESEPESPKPRKRKVKVSLKKAKR